MNIKNKSTEDLLDLKKLIDKELNHRSDGVLKDIPKSKLKNLKSKAKKLMKGNTITLKIRPELKFKTTTCLNEDGEIQFYLHGAGIDSITTFDIINDEILKNLEITSLQNKLNDLCEELNLLNNGDGFPILELICDELEKEIDFAPGFGIWR